PLWRKDEEGKTICNACGLYYKLYGSTRPISMKSDIIRKCSHHDARTQHSSLTEPPSASNTPGTPSETPSQTQTPSASPGTVTTRTISVRIGCCPAWLVLAVSRTRHYRFLELIVSTGKQVPTCLRLLRTLRNLIQTSATKKTTKAGRCASGGMKSPSSAALSAFVLKHSAAASVKYAR
ncbi:hypothetical protein BDR05DRAFT_897152, partial [Suillus weaverae]